MSILTTDKLISLTEVCALLPGARGAKRLHRQTIARWIEKGVKGKSGERVKLEAKRVGHRWLTTAAAVEVFFALLAEMPEETDARLSAEDEAHHRAVEAELDRMGA